MDDEPIKTEAELIAVLSVPGRYMEFVEWEEDGGSYQAYVVRQYPQTDEIVRSVEVEFAKQWAKAHDFNDPLYGPYCSTWSLPEFRPDISEISEIGTEAEPIAIEEELIPALSVPGRTLEVRDEKWTIRQYPDDPRSDELSKVVLYVDPEFALEWTNQKDMEHPYFGPFCGSWSIPEFRLKSWN